MNPDHSKLNSRKKAFKFLGIACATIFIIYGLYYLIFGRKYESTDNAYVGAEVAQVAALVNGVVSEVRVTDTMEVKKGDILVILDPIDIQLKLDTKNAELARAQSNLDLAYINHKRRLALFKPGFVSDETVDEANNKVKTAQAELDVAHAALAQANIDKQRTIITAPVDGIIVGRKVQLGQNVEHGMTLLSIVPIASVHVDANLKESQLKKIRIGQPVTLTSDLYGSSIKYHGKVVGLGGGTGSAFALIPAQNATGNWIKVVQRLPVRISLDPNELQQYPLRVGLSMEATINVSK